MYYCEKCYAVSESDRCQYCGKKSLQEAQPGNYCLLIEADDMFAEMFMGILQSEDILHRSMPSGDGVRSRFALGLGKQKIFVPYELFDSAKELLDELFENAQREIKSQLADNIGKLFASPRTEKRIRKALKLTEKQSVIDYCKDNIINADKIVDGGLIISCRENGSYLYVYKDNLTITVNSATYEILSAKNSK